MGAYIVRRLLQAIIVLILVTLMVYLAMNLLPSDPLTIYVTEQQVAGFGPEKIEQLKQELGLDKPVIIRYFDWLGGLFHGNLGRSLLYEMDASELIALRLPVTLQVGLMAFVINALIGIPAGVISAARRSKFIDNFITFFANIGITVPSFWLGYILVFIFALKMELLPVYGYTSPFEDLGMNIKQMILPVICLSVHGIAGIARQSRSSMLEVISQDYIRTAWSKGLTEWKILMKHALKNGMIPVITFLGLSVRAVIGGTVIIETVFEMQGIGRLATNSVFAQDYQVVQAVVLMIAFFVTVTNLAVDLLYGVIDPRIRYS